MGITISNGIGSVYPASDLLSPGSEGGTGVHKPQPNSSATFQPDKIQENVAIENLYASNQKVRDPLEAEALLARTMQQISDLSSEIMAIHGGISQSALKLI